MANRAYWLSRTRCLPRAGKYREIPSHDTDLQYLGQLHRCTYYRYVLGPFSTMYKNVKARGIYKSLSFSDDLGRGHKCRSALVTCPLSDAPPVVPSPVIAASFHEFHARLFPLFFPGYSDVGICLIRVNNSVVTLSLSQAQQHR